MKKLFLNLIAIILFFYITPAKADSVVCQYIKGFNKAYSMFVYTEVSNPKPNEVKYINRVPTEYNKESNTYNIEIIFGNGSVIFLNEKDSICTFIQDDKNGEQIGLKSFLKKIY